MQGLYDVACGNLARRLRDKNLEMVKNKGMERGFYENYII